jgi:DNA excision repair protein ERCC-4
MVHQPYVIMNLFIDHRETKVIPILTRICEASDIIKTCEVTQLPLGDFLLTFESGGVLVERKSTPDFLSSIRSNRLWDQLLRFMKASTVLGYTVKRKLLIVHGTFDYTELPTAFWSRLMGAYMEILFVYDIPVILTEDDEAFFECMRILIKREKSKKNDLLPQSRWFRKHLSPDLPEMDVKRYVLSSIPTVGDALAGSLLDHFGTIKAVAHASKKQLQRVEGIGNVKAERIYEIFH